MLSVDEALDLILQQAAIQPAVRLAMMDALGLALAEDVVSDVDSPPHDKAMVDGYAIVVADLTSGTAELAISEEVTAGMVPSLAISAGRATRIMTGAPLPAGADAVVMVEHTQWIAGTGGSLGTVQINATIQRGQNIMRRGESLRRGEVVLKAGHEIRASEVGLLSEVGRSEVRVIPQATVSVLATGNELVPAAQTPAAGQIRNSNGPMLVATLRYAGALATDLGIARDEPQMLAEHITRGLESDVLVLAGGVSAGVLDLVPGVLRDLGVRQVFHKVNLKPGKPLWFGVLDSGLRKKLVFGLPGNPISGLVCCELFVKPALRRLMGLTPVIAEKQQARLIEPYIQRGERVSYVPMLWQHSDTGSSIMPIVWRGSADLRGFCAANALAVFPPGDRAFAIGEMVEVIPLGNS